MTLQDVFDQLTYGELAQVFMAGDIVDDEGISEDDKPRVLASVVLGLTSLYTKFRLKEGRFILERQDGQTLYSINKNFAQSNADSEELVKYIDDSIYPFDDRIIKIEQICDEDGEELPLNEKGNVLSLRTPTKDKLFVPADIESSTLEVVYRENHPAIHPILGPALAFQTDLELPDSHLQALLYFIASRILNPVGISQEFHEGNNYAAKYEHECQRLLGENLEIDNIGVKDDNFTENGWV